MHSSNNPFIVSESEDDIESSEDERDEIYSLTAELSQALEDQDLEKFSQVFDELDDICDLAAYVDLLDIFEEAININCYPIADFLLADAVETNTAWWLTQDLVKWITRKNLGPLSKLCNNHNVKLSFFAKVDRDSDLTLIEVLAKNKKYKHYTFADFFNAGCFDFQDSKFILYLCTHDDNLEFLKVALQENITITDEIYKQATSAIKSFLDYRPGSKQPSILEYSSKRRPDVEQLNRMVLDFDDTTSEESSADEDMIDDEFIPSSQPNQVLLARGSHFGPTLFSQNQRRSVYQSAFKPRAIASMAALKATNNDPHEEVDEESPELQQAHSNLKDNFNALKMAVDHPEPKKRSRNAKSFDALIHRFIQAYVMDYNYLINQGNIQTQFSMESSDNPLVSTSKDFSRAAHYASGMRTDERKFSQHRLDPHFRRSTAKPKHPHLGFTDIFLCDAEFLADHAYDIQQLIANKKIYISHHYQFENEVAIESMIPAQFNCGRIQLTLPRFDKHWTKEIGEKYGITQSVFTRYRNEIQNINSKRSDGYIKLVNRISKQIINAQSKKIQELSYRP